jgi:hypothetical protein
MTSTLDGITLYGADFQLHEKFDVNPKLDKWLGQSVWEKTRPNTIRNLTILEFHQYNDILCRADTEETLLIDKEALAYLVGTDAKIRRKMAWQKTKDILPLPDQTIAFSDGINKIRSMEVKLNVTKTSFDQRFVTLSVSRIGQALSSFPYWMNCSFAP